MIVLNVTLDNIYGFNDFNINFTYPKKIVNSIIEEENLKYRPYFRYKKAVVLMGANATGKTSLGKALLKIFQYINSGNTLLLLDMVAADTVGTSEIDFVNDNYVMHRLVACIDATAASILLTYSYAEIEERDTYEKCVAKLKETEQSINTDAETLKKTLGELKFRFAYPEIETTLQIAGMKKDVLLRTMRAVIGTLDPTLTDVSVSKDLKDSFIIRRKGVEIIIRDGKLLNREILSSGTAEGVDVAIFLASVLSETGNFYYCDDLFLHFQSDIEKRIFGIMLDSLGAGEQLVFTTHNTDMLDLNLPKHSFAFLCRNEKHNPTTVMVRYASSILKRNTDSIRCAVENDVFSSLPDDSLLDMFEK